MHESAQFYPQAFCHIFRLFLDRKYVNSVNRQEQTLNFEYKRHGYHYSSVRLLAIALFASHY